MPGQRSARSWTGTRRALAVLAVVATAGLLSSTAATADVASPRHADQHPIGTWGASADTTNTTVNGRTVRDIVHTSVGGTGLRIRVSNAFGTAPLALGAAAVGTQKSGAELVAGSNHPVTFGGKASVTVPAGGQLVSDPVPVTVPDRQNLAVSLYVPGTVARTTGHNAALQTSYLSAAGNHAAEEAATGYPTTIGSWLLVDDVSFDRPAGTAGAVATLGDSITDGIGSTANANRRWPDVLAGRLTGQPTGKRLGVLNEGISGNKILADGAGVSALKRLDRDVLSQPGVRDLIVLEGINDIGGDNPPADQLTGALRQIIDRAHAHGIRVIGATLTPFKGAGYYSDAKEKTRQAVNTFIRTGGAFDGVVDFDQVTRDPADPQRFAAAYDSGDHLHPSDAGYQAMGSAVNLSLLYATPWR